MVALLVLGGSIGTQVGAFQRILESEFGEAVSPQARRVRTHAVPKQSRD